MELDKIIEDLNRRFAEPVKEFYNRRIIFWFDDDGEFEDKIGDMELANAKAVCLTGSNTFAIKKQITVDDTASNFLVYRPFTVIDDDNWLLN
ncbi:MAG: BREX-1 system phosphatase PglZ type A, partial [Clostridia bacterium]